MSAIPQPRLLIAFGWGLAPASLHETCSAADAAWSQWGPSKFERINQYTIIDSITPIIQKEELSVFKVRVSLTSFSDSGLASSKC